MPNLLRLMSHLLHVMYTELDYITSMSRLRALWQASFNATKRGMFFPKVRPFCCTCYQSLVHFLDETLVPVPVDGRA
jgi:hypothetical protein